MRSTCFWRANEFPENGSHPAVIRKHFVLADVLAGLMVLAFAVPLTGYVFYRNVFTDSPLEGGSRLGLGVLLVLAAGAGTVYWKQAFGPSENRTSPQTITEGNTQPTAPFQSDTRR